jgi:hypothetical protein
MGEGESKAPPKQKTFNWALETWVYYPWRLLLWICPFHLVIDKGWIFKTDDSRDIARAVWVALWTVGLVVLWRFSPLPAWLCVALASVRLYEIYMTGIGTILSQRSMARARNVLTIVVYVIQTVFIFAILGQNLEPDAYVSNFAGPGPHEVASQPVDFLFIGWSNLLSLGNEFEATTERGGFLEVFATTTGIFLLSVLLAFGIDEVKERPTGRSAS